MRSWFWNCWIFTLEARKKFGLSWCSRGLDVFTYRSKNTSHHLCQKIFLQASVAELFIENLLNILTVINKTNALARKEKIEIQIQSCRSLISPPDHSYLARWKGGLTCLPPHRHSRMTGVLSLLDSYKNVSEDVQLKSPNADMLTWQQCVLRIAVLVFWDMSWTTRATGQSVKSGTERLMHFWGVAVEGFALLDTFKIQFALAGFSNSYC